MKTIQCALLALCTFTLAHGAAGQEKGSHKFPMRVTFKNQAQDSLFLAQPRTGPRAKIAGSEIEYQTIHGSKSAEFYKKMFQESAEAYSGPEQKEVVAYLKEQATKSDAKLTTDTNIEVTCRYIALLTPNKKEHIVIDLTEALDMLKEDELLASISPKKVGESLMLFYNKKKHGSDSEDFFKMQSIALEQTEQSKLELELQKKCKE